MSWWLGARARDHRRRRLPDPGRLKLLVVAVGFWCTFAVGIACSADGALDDRALASRADRGRALLVGAADLARGARLPLLHDHRPEDGAGRDGGRGCCTRSTIGLLATVLIAPMQTEYASKVALLGSLAIVCCEPARARPAAAAHPRAARARRRRARRVRARAVRRRDPGAHTGVRRPACCRRGVMPPIRSHVARRRPAAVDAGGEGDRERARPRRAHARPAAC